MTGRRLALGSALGALLALAAIGPASADPATICGRVDAVDAVGGTATVDGQSIPLAGLDEDAVAGLELAFNGRFDACADVEVVGGVVTETHGVTVSSPRLCGSVDPAGGTDVLVDRVLIPQPLMDEETLEILTYAAVSNKAACLQIDVSPGSGGTVVILALDMEICATVTDLGNGTVELDGIQIDVADGVDLEADEGDIICVLVSTAEGSGIEVVQRTDEDEDEDPEGGSQGGGGGDVPDTALPYVAQ
jgi:hypothetical protein